MAFEAVAVYDLDGGFIGYGVRKNEPGIFKLHTQNLWSETREDVAALQSQLTLLNADVDIRAHWPRYEDPEVQALLADENFEPVQYEPAEVVDDEKSIYVWIEPPSDENPYGKMDEDKSVIVTKVISAPTPASMSNRRRKAMEVVARRRAGA